MLLQKIRDYAQSWFAYTIIALLIIPFAVWGINYYFEGGGPMDAALVGDSKVTLNEFQRAYQQQRQRMQSMMGAGMDPALLEGPRLKQEVLRQLINERVLNQVAHRQGFRIGDQQLHDAVLGLPVFRENGGFSKDLYERLVRNQGFTVQGFEEGLRQSLAVQQLRDGVIASTLITAPELEQLIGLLKQQRDLQYLLLPMEKYVTQATVDDGAVQAYFDKNKDRFVNPEQVQIQFVELKLAQIAEGITVSEDELKTSYEEQITKYGRPEERQASHVMVKLAPNASPAEVEQARSKAQQLANEIRSGTKSFDQAMEAAKADTSGQFEAGALGSINKGMFDDPALENALFALKQAGDISDVVQMPMGFQVLRLDGITPAQAKPFSEVREAVAQELRQQKAENQFYEITQHLATQAYEHPDSLESAAKALNVSVQESDWFSRKGGAGITASPKVAETAFSEEVLKRGLNSEPIEINRGHVVVIRNQGHKEATPRTLDEAREEIVSILKHTQAREALAKDIEALKSRAAQGTNLQILAKEFGGSFHYPGLVGRDASVVDRAILVLAFQLPQPETGKVALGATAVANGDQALLQISQVVPGKKEALSEEERKSLAQQLAQQTGTTQFDGLLESLRIKTKVVTYNDRL